MILQIILWAALIAALLMSIRASFREDGMAAILWLFFMVLIAMVIGESSCGLTGCA